MSILKCVIVDDSLFIRETIASQIEEIGHQILEKFEDGIKLLDRLNDVKPDIVFLDIILPQITGLELIEHITKKDPSIKIVMLSGMADSEAVSAALRLGAIDFLQKPVSSDRLNSLLTKLSQDTAIPSIEEVSLIGAACFLVTEFLDKLQANSSPILRKIIEQQITQILDDLKKSSRGQFVIDPVRATIQIDSDIWGNYTEKESLKAIAKISEELFYELSFLYSEEVIQNLINQAILTMISKQRILQLFDSVSPNLIGFPELPILGELKTSVSKASTTYDELADQISLAIMTLSDIGPEVVLKLNDHLLTELEYMRNSIFFFTLIGQDHNFQEGLFGPLPVNSEIPLSSLIYSTKIENQLVLLCIYFTESAEKIVADYNKMNFLIKTRLSTVETVSRLSINILNRILEDIIQYLMEP